MAQDLEAERRVEAVAFGDRLADAVEGKRSQLVVGLDPRPDLLPVELRGEATLGREGAAGAVSRFCCGLIDAVAPHAVAVKPQLAFFECLGSDGMAAFEDVCGYARSAGLLVIADGKRGDIGSTARAYATAYLEGDPPLADALPRPRAGASRRRRRRRSRGRTRRRAPRPTPRRAARRGARAGARPRA